MKSPADIDRDNQLLAGHVPNPANDIFKERKAAPYFGYVKCDLGDDCSFSLFCANDCPASLSILHKGQFTAERWTMELWKLFSKKSKVALDIGSHVGVFSLATSSLSPKAKIYAFEPNPQVFSRLCVNILSNRVGNVKANFLACSDADGTARIHFKKNYGFLSTASTLEIDRVTEEFTHVEVPCVRLDSFVKTENLTEVDLIKIDVEDHEYSVLAGFSEIDKFKPALFVEILNKPAFQKVAAYMIEKGYNVFSINDKQPNRKNSVRNVGMEWPETGRGRNFLFFHKDRDQSILKTFLGPGSGPA